MPEYTRCVMSKDVHKRAKAFTDREGRILYRFIDEAVLKLIEQKENAQKN